MYPAINQAHQEAHPQEEAVLRAKVTAPTTINNDGGSHGTTPVTSNAYVEDPTIAALYGNVSPSPSPSPSSSTTPNYCANESNQTVVNKDLTISCPKNDQVLNSTPVSGKYPVVVFKKKPFSYTQYFHPAQGYFASRFNTDDVAQMTIYFQKGRMVRFIDDLPTISTYVLWKQGQPFDASSFIAPLISGDHVRADLVPFLAGRQFVAKDQSIKSRPIVAMTIDKIPSYLGSLSEIRVLPDSSIPLLDSGANYCELNINAKLNKNQANLKQIDFDMVPIGPLNNSAGVASAASGRKGFPYIDSVSTIFQSINTDLDRRYSKLYAANAQVGASTVMSFVCHNQRRNVLLDDVATVSTQLTLNPALIREAFGTDFADVILTSKPILGGSIAQETIDTQVVDAVTQLLNH